MKIYLVERQDDVGYDEYDSFVVRADNEEDAKVQCDYPFLETAIVTEITNEGTKGRILGSFNAG